MQAKRNRLRRVLIGSLLVTGALGGAAYAVEESNNGQAPSSLTKIDGGAAVSVGQVIGQGAKQNGRCVLGTPVGVSGTDEPGEGGATVLSIDKECTVRVKSIEEHGPKLLPNGEIDRDAYPAPEVGP